jgi:6-phosphogluconolactonase
MPELTVLGDAPAVARHAAAWLVEKLSSGGQAVRAVCLSGGTTPRTLYGALAQPPYREAMPWGRIHWFWCDERFVPATDERSNYNMVQKLLFERAPVPPEHIHRIRTDDTSAGAAAAAYEKELKRFYGAGTLEPGRPLFDLTLLGVGEDGHTASLFPGSPVLKERASWAACVTGAGAVPRVTLTYPVLESGRDVAFLVTGAAKRAIMQRIVDGEAQLPAAMLRPVGRLHWFVDRAAAPLDG